ncbi:MAG: hypothetical protein ACTSRP_07535 [Candidatus Helarchaeota archaeon]
MNKSKNKNEYSDLDKIWNEAVKFESYGHDYFYIKEYKNAAKMHLKSHEIFKKIYELIKDQELKKKVKRNYLIEYGNYFQCKAADEFYNNKDYQMAKKYFEKAAELMKEAIKEGPNNIDAKREIDHINMNIHYLLERAAISEAFYLINKKPGEFEHIIEQFNIAATHDNIEIDFATQNGDFERAIRAKARKFYSEAQALRFKGMKALQNGEIKDAKRYYLDASELFKKSSELDDSWEEYKKLATKMKNVANKLIA